MFAKQLFAICILLLACNVSLVQQLAGVPMIRDGIAPVLEVFRMLDDTWLFEIRVLEPVWRGNRWYMGLTSRRWIWCRWRLLR